MTLRYVLAACAAIVTLQATAEEISGKVVAVSDGDTMRVLVDRREIRVRLADIDAPELGQAFGNNSKQSLSNICFGKAAAISVVDKDQYGRTVGRVRCDGVDANGEQVNRGMAWVYRKHARSTSPLYLLEDQAQRNREGLWADKSSAAPWVWRKGKDRR